MRPRTPFEAMIDKATGFDSSKAKPSRKWVKIKCPICQKSITSCLSKKDPPETEKIEAPCMSCVTSEYTEIFFDKDGEEIKRVEFK